VETLKKLVETLKKLVETLKIGGNIKKIGKRVISRLILLLKNKVGT